MFHRHLFDFLFIAALLVIAAGLASATYVSWAEEKDRFCTLCHLPLEDEYVRRAEVATEENAADLASWHFFKEQVNCIGCHRGDGSLPHRAVSLSLGAWNTVKYLTGSDGAQTGSSAVRWLPEASCLRCHREAVEGPGFENHLHNLLAEFNSIEAVRSDPTKAIYCEDCHQAHTESEQLLNFLSEPVVIATCDHCHIVWERGPRGLR
jgi:hypothetical protein